jgi:catechol 2,3-dioxygenase-like lactoylglutathione lyase family enzyme
MAGLPYGRRVSGSLAYSVSFFSMGVRRKEEGRMKIGSIVVRCYEFDKMLAFWQEALGYVPREPEEDGWVVLRDPEGRSPNVSLERVPEPFEPLGKTSRVHLDLYTTDQEGEVERLLGIGATRYPQEYRPDADFIVLEDPDGNRFCVVQVPDQS